MPSNPGLRTYANERRVRARGLQAPGFRLLTSAATKETHLLFLLEEGELPIAVDEFFEADGVEAVDVDAGDGRSGEERIGGMECEFFDDLGGAGDRERRDYKVGGDGA